jgi:hypothetical protein
MTRADSQAVGNILGGFSEDNEIWLAGQMETFIV